MKTWRFCSQYTVRWYMNDTFYFPFFWHNTYSVCFMILIRPSNVKIQRTHFASNVVNVRWYVICFSFFFFFFFFYFNNNTCTLIYKNAQTTNNNDKCKQHDMFCLTHKIIMQYVMSNNVINLKQFFDLHFLWFPITHALYCQVVWIWTNDWNMLKSFYIP